MEMLGRYQQTTALSNINAGSCRWCFAVRNGKEYFIKEYLEPKHPVNDQVSNEEKVARKLRKCYAFEQEKRRMFQAINDYSDGNAVRIEDFFRIGAKYYMAMPRIHAVKMEEADVAALPWEEKRRLCAIIAHALACVHATGFIHSDIKHNNVIFTRTTRGMLTAKLIDYDAGYFEDSLPVDAEQLAGDPLYYAPELFEAVMGGEIRMSRKADIFSLGVLFHQYFVGFLPGIDWQQYGYTGEAVHFGQVAVVSDRMPEDLRQLLSRMLAEDPQQRPEACEIFAFLRGMTALAEEIEDLPEAELQPEPEIVEQPAPEPEPVLTPPVWGDAPGRHAWGNLGDL